MSLQDVKDPEAYAPMERCILSALKLDKPVTIDFLKGKIYGSEKAKTPRYWLITVNGAIRRLQEKLADNREPVRILRNKMDGKRAIETVLVRK